MAVIAHHGLVTTQGIDKYEPTFISGRGQAGTSKRYFPAQFGMPPSLPAPPPLSSFVTSFPKVTPVSAPVCTITIDTISPQIVANFELLRKPCGEFRFVYRSADSMFYDVSYYNAGLRRTIPLGRFQDPAVASLAHAIARDDQSRDTCRIVPFAAQEYIESLFTRVEVDANGCVDAIGRADTDMELRGDDAIDFEELFKLV